MMYAAVITVALCLSWGQANCNKYIKDGYILGEKLIEKINSDPHSTWTAGVNDRFGVNISIAYTKRLLGLRGMKQLNLAEGQVAKADAKATDDESLPLEYDARKKYANCSTIRSIKDQSNCGSCWAVSIAGVFSDRFCIHTNGRINVNMSAQHLTSCDKDNYGCNGGMMERGWDYIEDNGLPTGGDYESDEGCQPYQIMPCGAVYQYPCAAPPWYSHITPKCRNLKCYNDWYEHRTEKKIYKAKETNTVPERDDIAAQHEILKNGPVTAGMAIYSDFMYYKKGVYRRRGFVWFMGYHAVRIIGWGVENNVNYWLAANSWSKRWGDEGTFKIVRGENHCLIESRMHGGIPLLV